MQLWYAPTSPFARKVRIAAHELGIASKLALVEVNPWTDPRLRALNPLAKVPTLVTDAGEALWESGLICEHLDSLGGAPRLVPFSPEARWRTLRLQALADGAMTAAGRLYADENRPAEQRSAAMLDRFRTTLDAALSYLEPLSLAPDLPRIGEIATAALLGYLDFRWPERDWRAGRPRLAEWFQEAEARPSLQATKHPGAGHV